MCSEPTPPGAAGFSSFSHSGSVISTQNLAGACRPGGSQGLERRDCRHSASRERGRHSTLLTQVSTGLPSPGFESRGTPMRACTRAPL